MKIQWVALLLKLLSGRHTGGTELQAQRSRSVKNSSSSCTVLEIRFNKVAGEWLNLFLKSRVCYIYIENLNITNLKGNNQNVRYNIMSCKSS